MVEEALKTTEPEGTVPEAEIVEDDAVVSFSHNNKLLNKSMKIMDGKYGGAFYVRYIFDSGKGCGWLQLIVEYPTGAIQTQILCKNMCKASNFEEDGLGEVLEKPEASMKNMPDSRNKPKWQHSKNLGEYDIMRHLERPDMPIPLRRLWIRILENYEKIPITELQVKESIIDVYEKLLEEGEQQKNAEEKGYVLLTKDALERISGECGYTLKEIRTEFALRGLWECDQNSCGYQKTVKIGGKTQRFYALKTKVMVDKCNSYTVADNVEYDECYQTIAEEKEIEELKKQLAETKANERKMTEIAYQYLPSQIPQHLVNDLV